LFLSSGIEYRGQNKKKIIIIIIIIIVQTKIVEHVQVTYIDKHKNIYGTITISYELITEKIQAYLNN